MFSYQIGLIRLKLWEGADMIADSGNIIGRKPAGQDVM